MVKKFKRNFKSGPALSKRQYAAVAKVASKQVHKDAELKVFDGGLGTSLTIRTTALLQQILPPAQGVGATNRVGDSIYMKSLSINAAVSPDTDSNQMARIILFQWLENDTTAPVVGDILTSTGSATAMLHSFYVTNPMKKFKVLDDRLLYWDIQNSGTARPYRVKISSKDMAIRKPDFNAAATTGIGNFYLLLVNDSGTDGTFRTPLSRIRFYDN